MGGQISATSQFYIHGRSHFTRTGYEAHSRVYKHPDFLNQVNLLHKVFLVTGANAGIGKEITTFLASKGATVYMVCRNEPKAQEAKAEIAVKAGPGSEKRLPILICDCGLEKDVKSMWESFIADRRAVECSSDVSFVPRLDGLVCNAGALLNSQTMTSEGVEVTFATHLLFGTYLLGKLALPALNVHQGRLIIVSSGGMLNTRFPAWDVATSTGAARVKYDGQLAYAYAKRGQVLLAERWAAQQPGVKVVSCHPGWTLTGGLDAAYGARKSWLEPLRSLWQGAEGICWLCSCPPEEIESGAFYLDRSPQAKHMAGAFFREGTFTKNTPAEVDEMVAGLEAWSSAATRPAPAAP